jgi:hypothetical protein
VTFSESPRQVVEVVDYLLVTAHSHEGPTPAGFEGPVSLPSAIRIERLEESLEERLLLAAEPRGEDWQPVRQFHVVHAYVRPVWSSGQPLPDQLYKWDHEARLYPCVQLSRLVRDNATATEFAVRRLVHAAASEVLVPFSGFESHVAYRLHPQDRGWLDIEEAGELANLLDCYWAEPQLPRRVGQALRRVDLVTRERYLEDALPIVVGGIEALLKVGRRELGKQFARRGSRLATEFGIHLEEARLVEVWEDRSALVHGVAVDLSKPQDLDQFGQAFVDLQETLRRATRKAIEDPEFASLFSDDASIEGRWPA